MDFLNEYLILVVMGICLCVGYIIKHVVPTSSINRFIPLIMGVLGVGINVWINMSCSPQIVLGGLVSGLASTGMHEMFKNFIDK